MQVQVTNLDASRTVKIEVQDFDIKRRTIACVDEITLGPGEGRSMWIHAARQFVVTEDPLAAQVKPPEPTHAD